MASTNDRITTLEAQVKQPLAEVATLKADTESSFATMDERIDFCNDLLDQ